MISFHFSKPFALFWYLYGEVKSELPAIPNLLWSSPLPSPRGLSFPVEIVYSHPSDISISVSLPCFPSFFSPLTESPLEVVPPPLSCFPSYVQDAEMAFPNEPLWTLSISIGSSTMNSHSTCWLQSAQLDYKIIESSNGIFTVEDK